MHCGKLALVECIRAVLTRELWPDALRFVFLHVFFLTRVGSS